MFTIDITQFIPEYLLADKNGYALAKAIETALNRMNAIVQQGVNCIADYDTMPEWRLDELAWETNCLYDYNADIEAKRQWIKNAIPYYRLFGTPHAVQTFITGYFDDVELEEFWLYDGSPFHFRVTLSGEWTDDREAWARKAIAAAKNVRSVMDTLAAGASAVIHIDAAETPYARFSYPMTSDSMRTGTWPQANTIGIADDDNTIRVDAAAEGFRFPYTLAGTVPDTATRGVAEGVTLHMDGSTEGFRFPYNPASEGTVTGSEPDTAMLGAVANALLRATAEDGDAAYTVHYKLCGQDDI